MIWIKGNEVTDALRSAVHIVGMKRIVHLALAKLHAILMNNIEENHVNRWLSKKQCR